MFLKMRIAVLGLFIVCMFISGTSDREEKSPPINPAVYYKDASVYELVSQLPQASKKLIDSFYKNDHEINVKLDVIADIQNCP